MLMLHYGMLMNYVQALRKMRQDFEVQIMGVCL